MIERTHKGADKRERDQHRTKSWNAMVVCIVRPSFDYRGSTRLPFWIPPVLCSLNVLRRSHAAGRDTVMWYYVRPFVVRFLVWARMIGQSGPSVGRVVRPWLCSLLARL